MRPAILQSMACLFSILLAPGHLFAQTATLPSQPMPIAPITVPPPGQVLVVPANPPSPVSSPLDFAPPTAPSPLPSVLEAGPDAWGPLGPPSSPPGWFFDTEVALVYPILKFNLGNPGGLPVTGVLTEVPTASLDTTVTPTFEIGYRLPDNGGYLAFSYGFLLSDGSKQQTIDPFTYDVRSQVKLHVWQLDYGAGPYEFAPLWDIHYRIGAKAANLQFNTQATSSVESHQASNKFVGVGPHAAVEVQRRIRILPGLALFGVADGAVLIGDQTLRYQMQAPPGGPTLVSEILDRRAQPITTLNLQAGISFSPAALPGLNFAVGYQYDNYFDAVQLPDQAATGTITQGRGQFSYHGIFLRGRYDF